MSEITELENKLSKWRGMRIKVSEYFWGEVLRELEQELTEARKAHPFDYDALTEKTRQSDLDSRYAERTVEGVEYERQWSVDLHALAYRAVGVWFVVYWTVGIVALLVR